MIGMVFPMQSLAQNLPGPADAGRINTAPAKILTPRKIPTIKLPENTGSNIPLPENIKNIKFVLRSIKIEGMTAFSKSEIAEIYQPYLNKKIPISKLWDFASQITQKYQQQGYFLSRAYVPAQEIIDGVITLQVIEGYISDVTVEGKSVDNHLVDNLSNRLIRQRPTRLENLENTLLLLNDIPGMYFEAFLSRLENAPEGAISLTLKKTAKPARGNVVSNNHGSRYTGPHLVNFAYEDSFIPLQNTTISGLSDLSGGDKLWAISGEQKIRLLPEMDLAFSLGQAISHPGYTLEQSDIESQSVNWGIGLYWQFIRQRQQNLNIGFAFEGRNVNTDILGTALTRDRIRALRVQLTYDGVDKFGGYNAISTSLTRGISAFGASDAGEQNISRAAAEPDFTKLATTMQHQQFISPYWLTIGRFEGQYASKALYSSEEFGFGGPSLGRAYDSSEITGDHGVAASIEIQYSGIKPINNFEITPLVFYQIGKVWNIDNGQENQLSAATAGLGFNIVHSSGVSGTFTIAQPHTKSIDTPTYGNNGNNPRLYFQLGYAF